MKTPDYLLLGAAIGIALWPLWMGPGIVIVLFVIAAIVVAFGLGRAIVQKDNLS